MPLDTSLLKPDMPMNTRSPLFPERIYSLDVLRGIAALAVVFWHWQHFFYVGDSPKNFNGVAQPLFEWFRLPYQRGALAVELFFCISGFVFFWLFSKRIAERSLSASRFLIDRFSRLYPLHLVTLIGVAALQLLYSTSHGSYFVYQSNDLYHAMLNILLIPAWGFENGWSFNAPIWSVSVEVMLYAIMFAACLTRSGRYLIVPSLIVLGYFLYPNNYKLGSGIFTFFCGGATFMLMEWLGQRSNARTVLAVTMLVAAGAWGFVWQAEKVSLYVLMGLAFPALVALLAAISVVVPGFLRPFSAVGDISYASYLLHFPLQIIFALVVDSLGAERSIFYSPWMLVFFITVLIPLSYASHRYFEIPMQNALRRIYITRAKKP
ncbi:acyltransferase family protein [Pseudomonas putida]|uniref:acyltransferase family protein n=1 Tax=Pseudomonas putida TaxID=303 RepID=UPI00370A6784